MPEQSNNPFNFWQELKRRKVYRVIAMYAATAFIIMEAGDIMLPRLGLPDWTVTFIIVLLIIGFPVTIILSWIFDVTPEGIKKTESAKVIKLKETSVAPTKRKLKVSDVIIAVLIVIVIIMAYPKVFKNGKSMASMTVPVTILNESGEKETRQVFKDEYVHKVMIFPFAAEYIDTINTWLKYGIYEGILEDLRQFQYIIGYGDKNATALQKMIELAKRYNCQHFLTGTYKIVDGNYNITSKLYHTVGGTVDKEWLYQGSDLLEILDSISLQTRIDIGVHEDILTNYTDLPIKEHTTKNIEAYRYYILGEYSDFLMQGGTLANFFKALKQDSTFALAAFKYAEFCDFYLRSKISAQKYISLAFRHYDRMTNFRQTMTKVIRYSIQGKREMEIALSEMLYTTEPNNINNLKTLIDVYIQNLMFPKAEGVIIELNELVPDYPPYQIILSWNYLLLNKINDGLKFTDKRIEENPGYSALFLRKGQLHLHNDDLDQAEKVFMKASLLSPEDEEMYSFMMDHINFVRSKNFKEDDLQKFVGRYRLTSYEFYFDNIIYNDHLFRKDVNQWGNFLYPISDTSFFSVTGNFGYSGGATVHEWYEINSQGKVFALTCKGNNTPNYLWRYWKQDSLIINAELLLESNRLEEALLAFRQAYSENPEHYYLDNYIKHLEFIQSPEYEKSKSLFDSYIGRYDTGAEVYKENDQFYFSNAASTSFKLLPISEDQFMSPSRYNNLKKFVKEGDKIIMRSSFNDGRTYEYVKIN